VLDVAPTPRPPNLGWDAILAGNEPLAITPETNECGWVGGAFDYAEVIDHLVRIDQLE